MTHVLPSDLALSQHLFRYVDPASVPLTFTYGDRKIVGIPEDFHPQVTRTPLTADLIQYTITGVDQNGLEIRAEQIVYRNYPVNEWVVYLTNRGNEKTPIIDSLKVVNGEIDYGPASIYHGNGDDSTDSGYEWWTDTLDKPFSMAPTYGTSCFGAFPYFRLLFADKTLNVAIGWTGEWKADFVPTDKGIHLEIGQRRSHYTILPGETMRSPRVTFMVTSDNDIDRSRNMWRRWYLDYILPREKGGKPIGPKCAMHVFMADGHPEFTGANEQNQVGGIEFYAKQDLHPDIWWVDAGWYPCNYDWPQIGIWKPDPARFPNGLGPVGRACEAHDMQFLLWFEPERVRLSDNMAPDHIGSMHPEWLLKKIGSPDALLNLGDKACCDHLIEFIDKLIKDSHVHIYRQDFNFGPGEIWAENETDDRIGALENQHIQGYLRYWDALIDRNPGLWIDSCASGGHRNDLDTMRRAVPLQYTDVALGIHPIKQKQHREMFEWIPYFRAHNFSWDNAEDGSYVNGGRPIDDYAYQVAMAPALTDVATVNESEEVYECARKNQKLWRRVAQMELDGDYYPLTECKKDPHDWYAMQFDCPDTNTGFIQMIRNTQAEETNKSVYPHVDPHYNYVFTKDDGTSTFVLDGETMSEFGFTQSLPIRTGHIWFYEKKHK